MRASGQPSARRRADVVLVEPRDGFHHNVAALCARGFRCGVIEEESRRLVDGHDVIGGWCRSPSRGDASNNEGQAAGATVDWLAGWVIR
jgi:hypothetical protein